MPDVEPAIALRGLRKAFGDLEVLRGLDLRIDAGQRVALIGPSGSGKSTVLRVLMGLERPDGGEVAVHGRPLWTERGADRAVLAKVGMVFQHFELFPHMTVLRNLTEAPIHVRGRSRPEAEAAATELLALVGLLDKAHERPGRLSGGQKQRVAIARALAMEPDVLLFDEITSALDPELVGEVLGVLETLAERTSATMVLVTHQILFARAFADRVVFLDGGVVVEDGPATRVIDEPQAERTRDFLAAVLRGR